MPGVYNFSDEGVCSWYDFTVTIHRIAGIAACRVVPIDTADYPSAATRPFYSVMNKKKHLPCGDTSLGGKFAEVYRHIAESKLKTTDTT